MNGSPNIPGICQCSTPGGAGGTGTGLGGSGFTGGGISGSDAANGGGQSGIGGNNFGGGFSGSGASGDGAAGFAAAGTGGIGGAAGTGGTGGSGPIQTNGEPKLPTITEQCPQLKTGNITVMGQQVQLWVGTKQDNKKGAVMFYWHGTGSNSGEASLLGPALQEITSEGGIVASFTTTTSQGTNTGNNVWYTGDFKMADIILVCATQQLNIDTHRIYAAGCSAGGLQSGAMVYGRSSYLAGAMPNSGGIVPIPGVQTMDDPSHVPSLATTHGGTSDMVGVSFSMTSATEDNDIASKGGYVMDCDHGGGHCMAPAAAVAAQWTFLKAHPFGVASDPYAGGLTGMPTYCKIIK
jgi:poly(3-hydroxybutyrate) depolymerase